MKTRLFFVFLFASVFAVPTLAQNNSCAYGCRETEESKLDFGRTLRADYIFTGTASEQQISLDELSCFDGWAGRRHNMDSLAVRGNGQISMTSLADGSVLYVNSFSTLFQEWLATEEAVNLRRSFEAVFLLPMPAEKVSVRVELYGFKGEVIAGIEHTVDPADILIRRKAVSQAPCFDLLKSGDASECIDVVILAEGYTLSERELFLSDARTAMEEILSYEPFSSFRDRFNFRAVALESAESGVSVPLEGLWKNTALSAHFSTFYMDRYLTTLRIKDLHNSLTGIPYEHIIILANTDTYGGGGIYNSYTLTTAHHPKFKPVVVHEFGHSFCGLGDEYYYDDMYTDYYYPDAEPWEQNLTTLKDFSSKWADMLPEGASIPTAPLEDAGMWQRIASGEPAENFVGVYQGGGYQSKGVYRPFPDCRMKTNAAPVFCPVCQRAIRRYIEFNLF